MGCECTVALPGPSVAACKSTAVILFMTVLERFLRTQCDVEDPCGRVEPRPQYAREYDFIVVGGGSAGCVVASRLSEVPHWRILVVEAGLNEPTGSQVPALWSIAQGTSADWQYTTEPEQGACLGFEGRRCPAPRGKVIGGSSVLNRMFYVRGSKKDFDDWEAMGNYNWSYGDVLPYFLKTENNLQLGEVDRGYHRAGGYLPVTRYNWQPPMAEDILKAAQELGQQVGDVNGEYQKRFTILQTTSQNGVRYSASRSFIRPVKNRANLDILLNTTVLRVLVTDSGKKAYGIEIFTSKGEKQTILANKEIILCAGSINSPQILLLSGIGNEKDLEEVGIRVVHHLPGVGKNLQNHVSYAVRFFINDTDVNYLNWATVMQYSLFKNGPLSGYFSAAGFLDSRFANANEDHPDIQIVFEGYSASCSKTGAIGEFTRETDQGEHPRRYINVTSFCLRPRSRGYIALKDGNPLSHPKIVMNYFQDPEDMATIIEGIKFVIELTKTEALQKYGFELARSTVERCENITFGSDEYWECAIRTDTKSGDHQSGSCKMGPSTDVQTVVDPELRVHGMKGLRVVDASTMPIVPSGNIYAPTLMIAEKGSDMIKQYWLNSL